MILQDVLDRINFATATQFDLTGKSVNSLFTNSQIIMNLKTALDKYASTTRGIEGLYSFPLDSTNLAVISEPPLALRSRAYRFVVVYIGGVAWPININGLNDTYGNFPVQTQGLPTWGMVWQKMLYMFPQSGYVGNITTLVNPVGLTDTTITVASANNFPVKNGRISIGNETIFYGSRDDNNFYYCVRGSENTTPAAYTAGVQVNENNVWIYYHKLHWEVTVNSDDSIDDTYLNQDMEVYDEHLENVIDYCTYKLLKKVDMDRAKEYKANFEEWLEEAKLEIESGRQDVSQVSEIGTRYWFERQSPFGSTSLGIF